MRSFNADSQTILFLAANPKNTERLQLDQELRDIAEGLQRAQKRDWFNLEQRLAVRPRDIQRAMLDVSPQIIHFSGHSSGEQGLVFEDDIGNAKLVDRAALAGLFELFADQITCVVLNGCYSKVQARAIAQHIPHVIGMNKKIGDKAAITFAVGFYDALGAGRDVEFAYKMGCSAICLEGIAEHLTPVLLKQSITEAKTAQPKSNTTDETHETLKEDINSGSDRLIQEVKHELRPHIPMNSSTVSSISQPSSQSNPSQAPVSNGYARNVPISNQEEISHGRVDSIVEALKSPQRRKRFSKQAASWLEINLEGLAIQVCEAVFDQRCNENNEEKYKFQTDIEYYLELVKHTLNVFESTVYQRENMEYLARFDVQLYIQALEYILVDFSGSVSQGLSLEARRELNVRLSDLIKILRGFI